MIILNKILKVIDKALNYVIISIFIFILFVSVYGIYDMYATYEDAELPEKIVNLSPDSNDEFDIFNLKEEINKDIIAWIKIDNTSINYPITQGVDNSHYLTYNYENEYSMTGSVFLDYRNNKYFDDDISIIYAHNMRANMMFGGLSKYENTEYLKKHSVGTLYTELKQYKIEVYGFAIIDAYSELYNLNLYSKERNSDFIRKIRKMVISKDIKTILNEDDKILLLSTCRGLETDNRSVLIVKLLD